MPALRFRRIRPALNEFRFYDLRITRDLWGMWMLVRRWGRIGVTRPRERIEEFVSYHAARQACRSQVRRRRQRGYRPP